MNEGRDAEDFGDPQALDRRLNLDPGGGASVCPHCGEPILPEEVAGLGGTSATPRA